MSETSARASLFARRLGSRARNGLMGRRAPASGGAAAAGALTGEGGGVSAGTETGAGAGVAAEAGPGNGGVVRTAGVAARGVGRSGGKAAPSPGDGDCG